MEGRGQSRPQSGLEDVIEPMLISCAEVLGIFDSVLKGREPVGTAYLFAIDVVDSVADGTARLEDPSMLEALGDFAAVSAVSPDLVEQIRDRLATSADSGTA